MDDIDIDELTVEELIMLLDRSLDPALPVPVLMKAGQRLAELDPRVMPARPGPPVLTAAQIASAPLAPAQLASKQHAAAPLVSAQSLPAQSLSTQSLSTQSVSVQSVSVPEPRPQPEPVS